MNSFEISAIMESIEGWEKTGRTMQLPIYGKQRVYARTKRNEQPEQSAEQTAEPYQMAFGREIVPGIVPYFVP